MTSTTAIRTPDQRLRVFVSSTLQELAEERAAARSAIRALRLSPVMFELGARAHPPRDLYRAYLAQSDVFLGIYWQRYGWVAPGESISGLEDELVLAGAMPKLIYIKRATDREERLQQLIGRIQSEDRASYRPFSDAAELVELIQDDLALMLTERFSAPVKRTPPSEPIVGEAAARARPPAMRGALVGRERELSDLQALLGDGDAPVVTLTGPGGTGKTQLALHLAHALAHTFADGVYWAPLAGVREAAEVVPSIVATLEVPMPQQGGDAAQLLAGFLRSKRALLVLDNFEQVLDAAPALGELLAHCPHLRLLVTSREPLRIAGEHELQVPPLAQDAHGAALSPAMALFEQRAIEVRRDFRIDDDNRAAVAEICRRLDALPLAIELAASRIRVLTPQAMLPRLDKCLALLTSSRRDVPERQQTLRGALDWSHELLRPEERAFFRRLGAFTGTFSEEAVVDVVGDVGIDVLDGLTSLTEKSLLVRTERGGWPRFHLLETVREYARERLAESGEERDTRLRHARWAIAFLDNALAPLTRSSERPTWIARVTLEEPNTRAALRYLGESPDDRDLMWTLFARVAYSLQSEARGSEVRRLYRELEPHGPARDPLIGAIARGQLIQASVADFCPEYAEEVERLVRTLEESGDRLHLPSLLVVWGMALFEGNPARATEVYSRAADLAVTERQHVIESWARAMISFGEARRGDLDAASRTAGTLIERARKNGDVEGATFGITIKGRLLVFRGDLQGARTMFGDAVAQARDRAGVWSRSDALLCLCSVTAALGDIAQHRALLEETVHFNARFGTTLGQVAWGAMACLLAQEGEIERARIVLSQTTPGFEDDPNVVFRQDPTGALIAATRKARELLRDHALPEPADPEVALDAALGRRQAPMGNAEELSR